MTNRTPASRGRARRSASGFTLIEVMAVISLIAILTTRFIQNAQFGVEQSRWVACEQDRILFEGMELQYQHKYGKVTTSLNDLVTAGFVNKVGCPRGGVLAWEVVDPKLGTAHLALVCSIHGPKRWLTTGSAAAAAATTPATPPASTPPATPVITPPVPPAALSDGFDGKVATGWTATAGKTWQVSGGRYVAGTTGKGKTEHRSFTGNETWTDYTVDLKLNLTAGTTAGVLFRTATPAKPSGYVFGFDSKTSKFTLSTVKNGTVGSAFASAAAPAGFKWVGTDHAVSIDVKGSTFTVTVDGAKAVTGTNKTYTKGAIGLRVASGSVASFDNVVVKTK